MHDQHTLPTSPSEEASHHVNYMAIFKLLCILTAVSVAADVIGGSKGVEGALGVTPAKIIVGVIVLTIACFKALSVLLYFMHIKFEGGWKYVLLLPTTILAVAIGVTLTPDIGLHYYDVQVPQVEEYAREQASPDAVEHHGEQPATKVEKH